MEGGRETNALQERVYRAAEQCLERDGAVGPLELLQQMLFLQPVHFQAWQKGNTEGFIKITDTTSGKVVTVIEVLSLTNKLPGEGQQLYRQKQKELNAAGTSLTDYTIEPDPPLDPATAAWANELLKSKGLR